MGKEAITLTVYKSVISTVYFGTGGKRMPNVTIEISLPQDKFADLELLAESEGMSVTDFARHLLCDHEEILSETWDDGYGAGVNTASW